MTLQEAFKEMINEPGAGVWLDLTKQSLHFFKKCAKTGSGITSDKMAELLIKSGWKVSPEEWTKPK